MREVYDLAPVIADVIAAHCAWYSRA